MFAFIAFGLFVVLGFHVLYQAESTPQRVENTGQSLSEQHQKFIRTIAPEAQKLQGQYNILPSITIAQAILESQWGESDLASKYNNLFGVKAQGGLSKSVYLDTQEFVNGEYVTVKARFQVYSSYSESLSDHARLLAMGTKWNPNQYADVVNATNYVQAAKGLQTDGYATDPAYTQKLIQIIKTYKLYRYDD
ncbi:mannosyl-glycoprotein endo-beta-N-acetylglucosamidase [Lentilactobacillus curieae]|uniref:Mannosyl-glycoprotein endo-beta-N-acetylglucosamidase n=1 Tax=Lentilactobacillus curieae TaxID=1138822 RepID=A0A1S6QL44_9LACO|nr:glycoside hydrolase family 73 protein [Lentilactobacillus curieae]AQW22342.1 mannosyl-glycoprotein endo-beta-N-acetylglucosamidase [Lentilactobacillus curieae]